MSDALRLVRLAAIISAIRMGGPSVPRESRRRYLRAWVLRSAWQSMCMVVTLCFICNLHPRQPSYSTDSLVPSILTLLANSDVRWLDPTL